MLAHTHTPAEKESTESPNLDPITTRDLPRRTRLSQDPTVECSADKQSSPESLELSFCKKSEPSSVPSKLARNDHSSLI